MKLETILDALLATYYSVDWPANLWEDDELPATNVPANIPKRRRQYRAFRARILKMDADKNKWIKELLEISTQERLLNEIAEKDKRIVKLEDRIKALWWDQDD